MNEPNSGEFGYTTLRLNSYEFSYHTALRLNSYEFSYHTALRLNSYEFSYKITRQVGYE